MLFVARRKRYLAMRKYFVDINKTTSFFTVVGSQGAKLYVLAHAQYSNKVVWGDLVQKKLGNFIKVSDNEDTVGKIAVIR